MFPVGSRVRVNNAGLATHGQLGTVIEVENHIRRVDLGHIVRGYSVNSLTAAPDAAPPAPVVTVYRNVFQNGRVSGWYSTTGEAREAAPRCVSFERGSLTAQGITASGNILRWRDHEDG